MGATAAQAVLAQPATSARQCSNATRNWCLRRACIASLHYHTEPDADDCNVQFEEEEEVSPGGARVVPEDMLQTDTRVGLTSEEVLQRRRKYGLNQMKYVAIALPSRCAASQTARRTDLAPAPQQSIGPARAIANAFGLGRRRRTSFSSSSASSSALSSSSWRYVLRNANPRSALMLFRAHRDRNETFSPLAALDIMLTHETRLPLFVGYPSSRVVSCCATPTRTCR